MGQKTTLHLTSTQMPTPDLNYPLALCHNAQGSSRSPSLCEKIVTTWWDRVGTSPNMMRRSIPRSLGGKRAVRGSMTCVILNGATLEAKLEKRLTMGTARKARRRRTILQHYGRHRHRRLTDNDSHRRSYRPIRSSRQDDECLNSPRRVPIT